MSRMRNLSIMILIFSVIVLNPKIANALFEISIDRYFIDFGLMAIGEFKEISDQGDYHNEITCKSDNGQTWYLKLQLLMPFQSEMNEISPKNFKWKVVQVVTGTGYITNENEFNDFSSEPMVAYTSSPEDNAGREVKTRFTYGLKIPRTQVAGNYQTTIRFTLTETL